MPLSLGQEVILAAIPDIVVAVDNEKVYTWANSAGFEFFGKDVIGKEASSFFVGMQNTYPIVQPVFEGAEGVIYVESWQRRKDGQNRLLAWRCRTLKDDFGNVKGALSTATDITSQRRAEEALRRGDAQLEAILESAADGILAVDDKGKVLKANRRFVELWRIPQSLIESGDDQALLAFVVDQLSDPDAFLKKVKRLYASNAADTDTLDFKDGRILERVTFPIIMDAAIVGRVWSFRDISERRRAEEELKKSEERFKLIFEYAPDAYYLSDLTGRFIDGNKAAENMTGFEKGELIGGSFLRLHLLPLDQLPKAAKLLAKNALGKATGPDDFILRKKSGDKIPVEISTYPVTFENRTVVLGIARDITERKKAEAKTHETLMVLRKAFGGIIQVLSAASEIRDPYTAGHQRRVADLARAIAQEMGLAQDRVEGIRLAGIIHDIGKLSIPAEILSKPALLSKIEYQMIQSHAEVGRNIIGGIEFAWPIAQMIHQHHERMDGSGYPGRLKGNDILLEARILAVADVIEAMASHRPYRAALGIEAALMEIENGKGVLFDPDVVAACMALFRDKGFKLKD